MPRGQQLNSSEQYQVRIHHSGYFLQLMQLTVQPADSPGHSEDFEQSHHYYKSVLWSITTIQGNRVRATVVPYHKEGNTHVDKKLW